MMQRRELPRPKVHVQVIAPKSTAAPLLGPPPKKPVKDPGAPGSNMGLKRRLTGRAMR